MSTTVAPHLTVRQKQVLDLLVRGYTNARIAEALGVSLDGAKWHVREIIAVLGVAGREDAAEFWREYNGLPRRLRRFALAPLALIGLRAAPALVGLALVPLVVLAVVIVGNQSDDVSPAETESPTQSPMSSPSPTTVPAIVTPVAPPSATAAGVEQPLRTLRAEPPTGDCDQVFTLVGEQFDAGGGFEFHRWNGLDETVVLGTATSGQDGTVTLDGLTFPEDCFPGAQYVYEARTAGGPVAVDSRAVVRVEQIGTFSAAVTEGCGILTVTGGGLPPGLEISLAWGEAGPFTHVFAEVGRVTVSDEGEFAFEAAFPGVPCSGTEMAIYGRSTSDAMRATWKAMLSPAQ